MNLRPISNTFDRTYLIFLVLALAGGSVGCQSYSTDPTAPAPYYAPYDWGFVNTSDTDLYRVDLFFDRHGQEVLIGFAGTLTPERRLDEGGKSGHTAEAPQRIPDTVTIRWQTPDHEEFRQAISLKGIMTNMGDFHGTIWLRYDDGKWHPIPLTEGQMGWRAIHGKSAAPNDK